MSKNESQWGLKQHWSLLIPLHGQKKKSRHTVLEQHEGVNNDRIFLSGWSIPLRSSLLICYAMLMSEANRVKYPQFPNPPDHSCAQCARARVCVERWECRAARVISPTALRLIRHCHSHDSSSPELATHTRDNNTHHAVQSCSATAQPCSTVISDWGMCCTHPLLLLLSSHFHFSSLSLMLRLNISFALSVR